MKIYCLKDLLMRIYWRLQTQKQMATDLQILMNSEKHLDFGKPKWKLIMKGTTTKMATEMQKYFETAMQKLKHSGSVKPRCLAKAKLI